MGALAETKQSQMIDVVYKNNDYEDQLKKLKPLAPFNINKKAIVDIDGTLAVLLPEKKSLVFKHGNLKTIVDKGMRYSPKGVWLHKGKNILYAFWWTKEIAGKKLWVKTSIDNGKTFSEKAIAISRKGVLPSVFFADDGADGIAVAYISERFDGYQLYFNRSLDGGKTWFEDDVRINDLYSKDGIVKGVIKGKTGTKLVSRASDPFITYYNKKLILIYQEMVRRDNKIFMRIVSKISEDFGDSWQEKEVFLKQNVISQPMHVDRSGSELFVSVFIPGDSLYTFNSNDGVVSWKQMGKVPNTNVFTNVDLMHSVLTKNKGETKRILSFTAKELMKKYTVKFYEYDKLESQWRDITLQITRKPITSGLTEEMYLYSKVTHPDIAAIGDKFVIAAWEDHSYLVPTVVYNYSLDGGETWQKEPLFINYPAKNIQRYPTFLNVNNGLYLLTSQFDLSLKGMASPPLFVNKVAEADKDNHIVFYLPTKSLAVNLTKSEKLKLLNKRAKEYWDYKIKGEFAKTYPYLEPIVKTVFTEKMFKAGSTFIKYISAVPGEVKLFGDHENIAVMKTKMKLSLLGNKEGISDEEKKPKEVDMNVRWGWFYDNWYLMPDNLFDRRMDF